MRESMAPPFGTKGDEPLEVLVVPGHDDRAEVGRMLRDNLIVRASVRKYSVTSHTSCLAPRRPFATSAGTFSSTRTSINSLVSLVATLSPPRVGWPPRCLPRSVGGIA